MRRLATTINEPPQRLRAGALSRWLCCAGMALSCAIGLTSLAHAQTVTSTVTYTYGDEVSGHTNAIGRLALVEEREGGTTVVRSASFDYDVRGNITRTVRVLDGATYTTDQTYDSLNRVETVTYPDTPTREVVTNTYDVAGNLKTVTGVDGTVTTTYVTDIQYDAFSKRTRLVLGNGTQTDYTYDADTFRLQQLRTLGPGGTLQDLNYTYDAVGNVQTIRDGVSAGYNESFDYDDLHRLTGAFGAYGSLTYAYNQIGNMTCNSQLGPCSAASANYAYPPSGATSVRPHAVNQAGPSTYTYDANGNMTSRSTSAVVDRSLTYDANNRPTSMTVGGSTVTFAYDYTGERVRKQVVGGAMTTYVGAIYECAASCTKYLFAGSTRVAQKTSDGTVTYFHGNHLGSTHVVTNAAGAKVEEIHYYPYGGTFSDSNGEAGGVNRRYTGQEMDIETGLYYYHARYYDPVLGRFVSADTVGVQFNNPQSLNRYSYVLNNPLKYVDPTGHDIDEAGNVVQIVDGKLIIVGGQDSGRAGEVFTAQWNPETGNVANGWVDIAHGINPTVNALVAEGQQRGGTNSFNIFYKGGSGTSGSGSVLERFARDLNKLGEPTVVLESWQSGVGVGLARTAQALDSEPRINVGGHSLGGSEAWTTTRLASDVRFDNLFTIDAVCFGLCNAISGNVNRNYNPYQQNCCFFYGGANRPAQGSNAVITNDYRPEFSHFSLAERQSPVYNTIISRIQGGP